MGNACKSLLGVSDEEWLTQLEQKRAEGQAILKRVVLKSDDVDWQSVIVQADFFHQQEEELLRKRLRRWRRKQTLQALDRRRRYESAGPFSVNLLNMSASDEERHQVKLLRENFCLLESQTASFSSEEDQGYENETFYNTERLLDSRTQENRKTIQL
jgi:hypothetical protein